VTPPGCFSDCARGTAVAVSVLSVVGLIAVCAKTVMVRPNEIGLARGFDGRVFVLQPGCHVVKTFMREVKIFDIGSNDIALHPLHIIRVLPGTVALCTIDGVPHIMAPGRHFINNALFSYQVGG
jgi:hypothetical protein